MKLHNYSMKSVQHFRKQSRGEWIIRFHSVDGWIFNISQNCSSFSSQNNFYLRQKPTTNLSHGRSWTHFLGVAEHSVPMKLFCFRRLEFYNIDVNVHQYSQYTETASTSVISWLKCLKLGCLSKKSWGCLSMTSMKALVGALNKDEALISIFPNYF